MRNFKTHGTLVALFVLALGAAAGSAGAVEDGLMGTRIGASYREVMRRFGTPAGVLISAGGGLMYQTMPARGIVALGQPGAAAAMPLWVDPVRVSFLANQQSEWVYDLRRSRGVMLGIVLSGEGADAVVTDVIVVGYPEYLKGKPQPTRTEQGVTLQSTFSTVLQRYGFPPQLEVYAPGTAPAPTVGGAGGGGARVGGGGGRGGGGGGGGRGGGGGGGGRGGGGGGGGRGGGRGGGGGGRGGMRGAIEPPASRFAVTDQPSSFAVDLTQGRGGRGGGRGGGGGGGRGGGGGGGRRGGGGVAARTGGATAGLPPLGTAAATPAAAAISGLMATAIVDNQAVGFSRDCILTYNGIAFTLHDMRVFRIHVSE